MEYDSTGTQKGFLYSAGLYTELLPPGWSYVACLLASMTAKQWLVVGMTAPTPRKGFLYSAGVYTELCRRGGVKHIALGINDS